MENARAAHPRGSFVRLRPYSGAPTANPEVTAPRNPRRCPCSPNHRSAWVPGLWGLAIPLAGGFPVPQPHGAPRLRLAHVAPPGIAACTVVIEKAHSAFTGFHL